MPRQYPAVVRTQDEYADGREILYLAVKREHAEGLPFRENERVPIELRIGDARYTAGLRTTPPQPIVYVSSDLVDASGGKTSLAAALESLGIRKNDRVTRVVEGMSLSVEPAEP